jgi:hypothetical protein
MPAQIACIAYLRIGITYIRRGRVIAIGVDDRHRSDSFLMRLLPCIDA